MIVDCSVDVNLNVVLGKSFLLAQVDDVGFHIQHMDSIGEGVKIL
jgi:hypothetical protein